MPHHFREKNYTATTYFAVIIGTWEEKAERSEECGQREALKKEERGKSPRSAEGKVHSRREQGRANEDHRGQEGLHEEEARWGESNCSLAKGWLLGSRYRAIVHPSCQGTLCVSRMSQSWETSTPNPIWDSAERVRTPLNQTPTHRGSRTLSKGEEAHQKRYSGTPLQEAAKSTPPINSSWAASGHSEFFISSSLARGGSSQIPAIWNSWEEAEHGGGGSITVPLNAIGLSFV